eukprot:TRINITY_DN7626_c0_g1_i1.p1 TRINITY_DN7626_c0_g1~~TRINITY_DN7626_c0_g1_i1.p1  ORF type:complete len:349 (-),score=89.88 TRINITY_DN7626_c0_g1_i1:48-1094(-)
MAPSSKCGLTAISNTVTSLDLSCNRFSDDFVDLLSHLIILEFPLLVDVNLEENQFTHKGQGTLLSTWISCPRIRNFNLGVYEVGKKVATEMLTLLREGRLAGESLWLKFDENFSSNISPEVMTSLLMEVRKNYQTLKLVSARDAGFPALKTICEVCIPDNIRVSCKGIILSELDFHPVIEEEAAMLVYKSLASNLTISKLTMNTMKPTDDVILRESLKKNSELQYLNYDRLILTEEMLTDLMNYNKSLCRLEFRDQMKEWSCNNYTIIEHRNKAHSRLYRKEVLLGCVRRRHKENAIPLGIVQEILEMADLMGRWNSISLGELPPYKLHGLTSWTAAAPPAKRGSWFF